MGIPEKCRAVNAMYRGWKKDLRRLESLFGRYDHEDFSDGAEMQRNLGTAVAFAVQFLSKHAPGAANTNAE